VLDKSKLKLPPRPKLTQLDLCQGQNECNGSKDLVGWLEHYFTDRDTRIYIERQFGLKIGILSHGLIKWSDEVSKATIVKTWKEVMNIIYS